MSYNNAPEDEQVFPPWMDREFFQKVLIEANKDDSVKVTEFLLKPGSNKGDHYASVMYRSIVNYETSKEKNLEISLIIKTMPFIDGMKKDFLGDSGVFDTEIKIYSKTLPMIQETLAKAGDNTQIACKCIYTSMDPHQILIFEDLTKKNYKPVSGIEGSLPIVKIALSKLARYHAVCFKTNSETGEIKKDYEKIQFDVEKLKQMPMLRDGFPFFLDMLKTFPDLKEYVPIFERIAADKPVDKAYSMFDDCKANWMILTHGDFHLKNIMLSEKEDGSVDDVLLIDFQACCWGPAITDITYMLYMMLDTKTRLERRDEVIYHYYKEFTETLRRINFTGEFPKLTDLYKDILSFKDYELLMATSFLPFVPTVMKGGVDIELFMHDEQLRRDLYKDADYQEEIKKLLPFFLHRGYLD